LIADRRWLTIGVAAAVALALGALAWLVFGAASWLAFLQGLSATSHVVLGEGGADWNRLQSLFGLMRAHGAGEALAWGAQAGVALVVAVTLVLLWLSRATFELKAAALTCGALLATPYVYMYDLVVLAVAVGFLLRDGLQRGFSSVDGVALTAAALLILAYPYAPTPVGLAATLIVAALTAFRACCIATRSA
jgi:arabinofuranan 3-O-arabinosyltransferase